MKEEMFEELLESIREAGAIKKGEKEPSRSFMVDTPDVKAIRTKCAISRNEFADRLGISVRTLENWEQGRRTPNGPARVLLQILAADPNLVWRMVDNVRKNREAGTTCS